MLKRLTNAAVIAVALCLAIGFGVAVWGASNASLSGAHQNVSAHGERSRARELKHESPEEAIARYNKWLTFFTAILAIATIGLGVATVGLYVSAEKQLRHAQSEAQRARFNRIKDSARLQEQIQIARKSAEAAKLNAEAIIASERAHLFVIIKASSALEALRGPTFYDRIKSASMAEGQIPPIALDFVIKNTGRSAAILRDISYQLIQADANFTEWTYAFQDTIVHPVIEAGQETAPPTPCIAESRLTMRDGWAVVDGERPMFFYGCVTFVDAFKRAYQYFWRYEYRRGRFVLVYEDEASPPTIA